MGLKYRIEYYNISNDFIQIDIEQDGFSGEFKNVKGKATLKMGSQESIYSPIRGMGMQLELEADRNLDFTDLYSDKETDFKVYMRRNDIVVFVGFVKPDGIWSDFVRDNWLISLECIDGLGVLKNLRFVRENGVIFSGLMSEESIIHECLKRTSLNLPINVRIMLEAKGQSVENKSILSKIRLNTQRFYKDSEDDDREIMDCEEILRSILEKYNAVIQQHNGEWFIFRSLDIFNANANQIKSTFFRYNDGKYIGTKDIDIQNVLGSNINSFFPHHANENQRIEIKGAVSAFRVKFDYGLLRNLVDNPTFLPGDNGVPAEWFSVNNRWEYMSSGGLQWNPTREQSLNGTWNSSFYELTPKKTIIVEEGDSFKVKMNMITSGWLSYFPMEMSLLTSDNNILYLVDNEWVPEFGHTRIGDYTQRTVYCATPSGNQQEEQMRGTGLEQDFVLETEPVPADGRIVIKIFRPILFQPTVTFPCAQINGMHLRYPEDTFAKLYSFEVEPSDVAKEREGEIHTAYLIPARSSGVEEPLDVFNGDMETDVYSGVMKLRDGKNTTFWSNQASNENKELLQIMVMDRIKMQNKPQKVFSGGVFGYLPSLSIISIDGLQGKFLPTEFNWDTKNDLCNFVLSEFFHTDDLDDSDVLYEKKYKRGKVIKPTIVG